MEVNSMEDETTMGKKEVQNCRCLELEERVSKAEDSYIELETELQKRNKEFESLELRFKELESDKLVVEEELRNLKESDKDSLFEQMMVNRALEFEKEEVEKESECWKSKFEKLVEAVRKLEEMGAFKGVELESDESVKFGLELARIKFSERSLGTEKNETCKVPEEALSKDGLVNHQSSGSLYITTPAKDCISGRSRGNASSSRRVNKMLSFEGDGRKSADVVELCDSETEEGSEKEFLARDTLEERSEKESDARNTLEERSTGENYENEDVEAREDNASTPPPGPAARNRKRVITSDSENDDDEDNRQRGKSKHASRSVARDTLEERSEKESDTMDTLEERSISEKYEDDDVEACEVNTSTSPPGPGARKRKLIITSDSENDDGDEDNIPISVLKKLKQQNQEMSDLVDTPSTGQRRVSSRLRKQRVTEEISTSSEQNPTERLVGIPTTGNGEGDETEEEEGSERESESLDGFIVDDDNHETVSEESDETGEESDDGDTGYADVMSRLRRDKNRENRKWEYEADMLADFGKDPELCMRAVCVLYRFQTEDEKARRSSHLCNGRGFSKFDADRGTRIGRFLTDREPECDLKKSVEELKSFDSKAVETCRDLAGRYSKQLFAIYNKREVPFFAAPPSP